MDTDLQNGLAPKRRTGPRPDIWRLKGPAMWTELHQWSLRADLEVGMNWLKQYSIRIPCGDCRRHWHQYLKDNPADFSSRQALFAWTVLVHNAVNRRLGKSAISLETAREIWCGSRTPPANQEVDPCGARGLTGKSTELVLVDCVRAR